MRNPAGAFWPSERQKLLLVAAMATPTEAVAAWQEVRPQISIDQLELGSFALLPLIYRNLVEAGHDDVDLPRLKGIYRRTWARNNLLLEHTKAIHEAVSATGIRVSFLEGVIIGSRFYPDVALRPTSVIDILVDRRTEPEAIAALASAGWNERSGLTADGALSRYVFHNDGTPCMLRTALAVDVPNDALSAETWQRSSDDGDSIPVPTPTDLFFATCVLHTRVEHTTNVQWIVDAKMMLRSAVDWERLLTLAEDTRQVSRFRDALPFLSALPGASPPPVMGERLSEMAVGRRQHLAYLLAAGAVGGPSGVSALAGEHLAATIDRSPLGMVVAFPSFLRQRWNLTRTWHVPFAAGKRALRRFSHRGRTR